MEKVHSPINAETPIQWMGVPVWCGKSVTATLSVRGKCSRYAILAEVLLAAFAGAAAGVLAGAEGAAGAVAEELARESVR